MDILKELKERTSQAHTKAEEHPLMAGFAKGEYKKEHLLSYLVNLRPLYEVVEQKLLIPYIHKNFELCRSRLISKDIAVLYKELKDTLDVGVFKIHPCTVNWISTQWSTTDTLVADLYVRWLADLYGGRRLAPALQPYNICLEFKDTPTAISDVREIILEHSNTAALKTSYYNYEWSNLQEKQAVIVNRAVDFFNYHIELFDCIYQDR